MALKVAKYLGIFQYSQDLSKIAQSGHTGERERERERSIGRCSRELSCLTGIKWVLEFSVSWDTFAKLLQAY